MVRKASSLSGQPLKLNDEANWNNVYRQTKEEYLERYMAKNLYYLSTYRDSSFGVEQFGKSDYITLMPVGSKTDFRNPTNDDEWFWQAPE